ncbi:hypothetical protein [Spirosoma sp. KNUC1025]|uniref:hypothetical protein n=1 Tax=Spirosoma sp. KNUC1025 TaxID=2894082 RepID=UPI00386E8262|nr:hypothetical protein LN737_15800 [Spirosoma sp. KNUC1025]
MKALYLLLLPLATLAQNSLLPPPEPSVQSFGRPWTVSFSLVGWQSFGPTTTIVESMKQSGWTSTDPGGCFFGCVGPTNFPRVIKKTRFDIEAGYQTSPRHGYLVSLGLPFATEITGRTPGGLYLYLQSRIYYGSFRWAWFGLKNRVVGSVGPALFLVQDFEKGGARTSSRHSQLRPGVHGAGQVRLVNKRTWLLAVKVDARIGLPASTGTYEQETFIYPPQGGAQQTTFRFSAEQLPTFHINLGMQIGFKFL